MVARVSGLAVHCRRSRSSKATRNKTRFSARSNKAVLDEPRALPYMPRFRWRYMISGHTDA